VIDQHKKFTRDVSSNKEDTIKFWKSPGYGFRSKIIFNEFLPLWDRPWGKSTTLKDLTTQQLSTMSTGTKWWNTHWLAVNQHKISHS